jgi:hypothetical protein
MTSRLQAVYYPYADVLPSQAFLEAALYFDRIYVLEPNFFRSPDAERARVPHAEVLRPLFEAGLVEPLGPRLLGLGSEPSKPILDAENLRLVRGSIDQDLQDPELAAIVAGLGLVSWSLPTGQQLYWNGLGLLLERPSTEIAIATDRPGYYRQFLQAIGYTGARVRAGVEERVREAGELTVEVPFQEAESLLTTVTLLAAADLGLHPFTDNPLHARFLQRKLTRLYEEPLMREAIRELSPAMREGETGTQTIRLHLPRLDNLTASTVVALRQRCADSLDRLRDHLRALSHQISSQPWSQDFEQDVRGMIASNVEPAVRDLKRRLHDERTGLGFQLIESAIKAAPIPLVLTVAAGLPPAVTLAAGGGIATSIEVARYLHRRRQARRHGLYFLLRHS